MDRAGGPSCRAQRPADGDPLAQGDARFTGTVRDTSGAVVSGATVRFGTRRRARSGRRRRAPDGAYTVGSLKPSLYTVRVAAGQFAPTEYTGLQLLPAQELTIDLELRPQGVTEQRHRLGRAIAARHELRAASAPT